MTADRKPPLTEEQIDRESEIRFNSLARMFHRGELSLDAYLRGCDAIDAWVERELARVR